MTGLRVRTSGVHVPVAVAPDLRVWVQSSHSGDHIAKLEALGANVEYVPAFRLHGVTTTASVLDDILTILGPDMEVTASMKKVDEPAVVGGAGTYLSRILGPVDGFALFVDDPYTPVRKVGDQWVAWPHAMVYAATVQGGSDEHRIDLAGYTGHFPSLVELLDDRLPTHLDLSRLKPHQLEYVTALVEALAAHGIPRLFVSGAPADTVTAIRAAAGHGIPVHERGGVVGDVLGAQHIRDVLVKAPVAIEQAGADVVIAWAGGSESIVPAATLSETIAEATAEGRRMTRVELSGDLQVLPHQVMADAHALVTPVCDGAIDAAELIRITFPSRTEVTFIDGRWVAYGDACIFVRSAIDGTRHKVRVSGTHGARSTGGKLAELITNTGYPVDVEVASTAMLTQSFMDQFAREVLLHADAPLVHLHGGSVRNRAHFTGAAERRGITDIEVSTS